LVTLTEEERLYQDAKRRYDRAWTEAEEALEQWKAAHGDDIDRYRELEQRVKDANQLLNDAERRWKV
jgi:hypothetical protein